MSVDRQQGLEPRWENWWRDVARPPCPWCGGERVWWNGRPRRSATIVDEQGRAVHVPELVCRRCRCAECRKSFRLHPPGVIPHKHYQPCVVAEAVARYVGQEGTTMDEIAEQVGCSRHTVARWLRWIPELGEPAVMLRMLLEATDTVLVPRVRAVAKAAGDVVYRAAQMLGLLEHLGSAWNLEPPGLRSVLCRVLRGRTGMATYHRPSIPELARGQPP